MTGDLADTSPVDVCLHLAGEGATGTLALAGPRGDAVLVFANGRLAGARPPQGRGARLGERLVSAGRLDRPDLDLLLAEQAAEPAAPSLGAMLVERGLTSPDSVRLFVQEQVLETLLDVLGWFDGQWDFAPSETDGDVVPDVAMPVDRALMEVRRRTAERDRVASVVPSASAVPTAVHAAGRPANLSPDAFTVLAAVDGQRTVAGISSALGFARDETSRQLYRLVLQGLVEFADTNTTPGAPAATIEEAVLSAPPAPRAASNGLADDDWNERRQEATTAAHEPEPWVGIANATRPAASPTGAAAVDAAATTPSDDPLWAPQHERASRTPSAQPSAPPAHAQGLWEAAREVAAAQNGTTPETPTTRNHDPAASAPHMDDDTRRALFSELHEVGRAHPSVANGHSRTAQPPPTADPTPAAADDPAVEVPTPAPESLSRSDVSDLLRELHDLNLGDG
jgi:hypothetical protein